MRPSAECGSDSSASCQNETNVGGFTDGGAPGRGQRIGARARTRGAHPRADLAGGARSAPRPLAGEPHAAQQALPRPRTGSSRRPRPCRARPAARRKPLDVQVDSRRFVGVKLTRRVGLRRDHRPAGRRARPGELTLARHDVDAVVEAVADLVDGLRAARRRGGVGARRQHRRQRRRASASSPVPRSSAGATCALADRLEQRPRRARHGRERRDRAHDRRAVVRRRARPTRVRGRHDRRGRRLRARRARPRDHDARLGPRPRRSPAARPQRAALRRGASRMLHRDAVDPEHHRAGRHRARP